MSLYPSFARPTSLAQASELLAGLSTGTVIIAGGQELMPHINQGFLQPDVYVDVGGLKELKGIAEVDSRIAIGALTVHRELQSDLLVRAQLPLLAESVSRAGGGRQVHNRGTIGGNIVAMHPLYDVVPALLALQAEVEIIRDGQLRCVALADLIRDTSHGLGSEAILVRVLVAPIPAGTGWAYRKLKLSGGAYGSANAAALATVDAGRISALRLVIGAVADRHIDASAELAFCIGQTWSDDLGEQVEARCASMVKQPLSDQQGSGEWRQAMAGVVARRTLAAALAQAE